jgi:hypothetical protein
MASGPTITAKFLADTSKLTGEVDKATSSAGSSLDGFAKKAAVALGGAFVVDKVVDFGKASVEAAAADEEAQAQLAAALKNTTGATDDQIASTEAYISKLSMSAAIADDDLRPAMATLARAFGNTEDAQSALSVATDVAAGTGKDLSAVTDAMAKAAMGNTGALKRLGVETKNADGTAKSLDQVMSDMAKTFEGQAAVAAGSTAGQMKKAQIAMGEAQETIGAALLPAIAKLATILTDVLLPAFTTVFGWLMDNKEVVIGAAIGIGVALLPMFISWAVAAGAAALATIAAAAPLIAIGAVVAGVAYLIVKNWDTIQKVTEKVWDAILGAVTFVWDWIKRNWPILLAVITGPFGAAVLVIVKNWDTIKGAAVAVFDWLSNTWDAVTGFITAPIAAARDTVAGYWQTVKDGATAVYDWIRDKFNAIAGAINGVVSGVRSAVESVANAIKAPINAVIRMWNGLEFKIPTFTLPTVDTHIPGVGKIGGGSYGGQTFGFPNLPLLASGGVLTSPTLFVGGEAGTEIVAPEDMLRAIVREEGGRGSYTLNIYPRRADASDIAYGFRRLELMAGLT